jgi:glycosyltransferase involved in cell wall biosynthesis
VKAVRLRWVTWWPAPYWVARFEHLVDRPDLDFEVVFLSGSQPYHEWDLDSSAWRFRYVVIRQGSAAIGYGGRSPRLAAIPRLISGGPSVNLVMPYGDPTLVVAGAAARLKKIPLFPFVPNTSFELRRRGAIAEAAKRWFLRGASAVLVPGPLQEQYVRTYVRPGKPVITLGNPVNTEQLRPVARTLRGRRKELRTARGWNEGEVVLAFVGRLAPEKALDALLEATARARAAGAPVRVALAGSGPSESTLRRLAGHLALPADFLGYLNVTEVAELYGAADVFVLPSISEAWGLVVNEAMEFSLPIVVSDRVGALPLVKDGRNGFVVDARSVEALTEAITKIGSDAELRRRMGDQSRILIEDQTLDRWADALIGGISEFGNRVQPSVRLA